ncbi:MAG: hypothetical protein ABGW78_12825 [Pirellulales bacterium]
MSRRPMSRRFLSCSGITLFSIVSGLAMITSIGCSEGSNSVPMSSTSVEPAKAAVATFLDAVKRGDDGAARGMLTKVAAAKTKEMGISVAPPVPASATYSIRECELVGDSEDLVHVATTWTDTDPDGFTTTDNVVWVVRLDPEGWRVVGMAMRVFDDMPPLLLNFEDPEDMLAKQQLVAAELQRRLKLASSTQSGTAPNPNSVPQRTARGESPPTTLE